MTYIKRYPTDMNKLRTELAKRGVQTLTDACLEMGRAHNYLGEQARMGGLSEPSAKFLKMRYNIDPESYAPDGVKPVAKQPVKMAGEDVPVPAGVDYDRLENVIYRAVYKALCALYDEGSK